MDKNKRIFDENTDSSENIPNHKEKSGLLSSLSNIPFVKSLSWMNVTNFINTSATNMHREFKKSKVGKRQDLERASVNGKKFGSVLK